MSILPEADSSTNDAEALIRFLGDVSRQAGAIADRPMECHLRPFADLANALWIALAPIIESFRACAKSIDDTIAAAPEIPGHQDLLIKALGYSPLGAKFMTRMIHHWGELQADEINEGRRVAPMIDGIAKAHGRSTLVIARRAKRFRDACSTVEAQYLIESAIAKAGLPQTSQEFNQLVGLACERDETACRDLVRTARQLARHLPEKRGRPISAETCIHLYFQRHLESWGIDSAYTYSENDDINDFVDRVTHATRLAVNNPRFSPLRANKLRKSKLLAPPMRIRDSTGTESGRSAARPSRGR